MTEKKSKDIFALIPEIMGECGSIGKTKTNKGQGYNFRGIDDVYQALQKILAKKGVFCVPKVLDVVRTTKTSKNGFELLYTVLTIKYTFYAADGSFFEAIVTGKGMDSGDKSANKAMSVAQKYALLQVFCIPTEDAKDPENDNHQVQPSKDDKKTTQEPPKALETETFTGQMKWFENQLPNFKEILGREGFEDVGEIPKDKEDAMIDVMKEEHKNQKG